MPLFTTDISASQVYFIWDLRFSHQRRFMLRSSGLWHHDTLKTEAAWTFKVLVSYHSTAQHHNLEDLNMKQM